MSLPNNAHQSQKKEFEMKLNSYGSFPVTRPTIVTDDEESTGCWKSLYSMFSGRPVSLQNENDESLLRYQDNEPITWPEYVKKWIRVDKWTHDELVLAGFVLALIFFSMGERIFFKAAVDDMAPFRAVLLIFIFFGAFLVFAVISIFKRIFSTHNVDASNVVNFPHTTLMLMAVVDCISFGGLVLSANGVSPTKTVILMHASTPCVVLGSKIIFSNRQYTSMQITGVALIILALTISLSDPLLDYINGSGDYKLQSGSDVSFSSSWSWTPTHWIRLSSAIMYTCAAALQGFANLFKEKSIIDYSLPTDIHTLSCWLFFYQFLFAIFCFPLFYFLQGISSGWSAFPFSSAYENLIDGLHCSLGDDPSSADSGYVTAHTTCSSLKWLVGGYALSTVMVLLFIDKLIAVDNQVLPKTMTFSVLSSFIAAIFYDKIFAENIQDTYFGPTDFLSIVVLIIGMETFSRDPEPDPQLVTNYSPVLDRYDT